MLRYPDDGTGTQAVPRAKLYEQIWSVPASQLAIHYGISDVGLAKICKQYRIPRPPRGYWAKLRAGKTVKRTPLPKVDDPRYETVYMKGWAMPGQAIQAAIDNQEPHSEDPKDDGGNDLHPLASAARAQLREADADHDGLVSTDRATALNIRVSPSCVDRAIAAFDLFIRRWQERGGEVRIETDGDAGVTVAAIGDDALQLRLDEHLDESRPLTDPARRTGNLCFWIEGDRLRNFRRRWSDTKSQRIERLTKPMIETLVHVLATKRTERLDKECEQRQQERVRARRQAKAEEDSQAFYWRQQLMQDVDRWHDAKRIREYLTALQAGIERGELTPKDEAGFREWFDWAKRYANSIDPLTDPGPQQHAPDPPENTPVEQLDLTSGTRSVVESLEVIDSDALWQKTEEEVRKACGGYYGAIWNEITRVLEGLGYDVSKRAGPTRFWW